MGLPPCLERPRRGELRGLPRGHGLGPVVVVGSEGHGEDEGDGADREQHRDPEDVQHVGHQRQGLHDERQEDEDEREGGKPRRGGGGEPQEVGAPGDQEEEVGEAHEQEGGERRPVGVARVLHRREGLPDEGPEPVLRAGEEPRSRQVGLVGGDQLHQEALRERLQARPQPCPEEDGQEDPARQPGLRCPGRTARQAALGAAEEPGPQRRAEEGGGEPVPLIEPGRIGLGRILLPVGEARPHRGREVVEGEGLRDRPGREDREEGHGEDLQRMQHEEVAEERPQRIHPGEGGKQDEQERPSRLEPQEVQVLEEVVARLVLPPRHGHQQEQNPHRDPQGQPRPPRSPARARPPRPARHPRRAASPLAAQSAP